jgi:hypothetical protein
MSRKGDRCEGGWICEDLPQIEHNRATSRITLPVLRFQRQEEADASFSQRCW